MMIKRFLTTIFFICLFFVSAVLFIKPVSAGGGPTIFFQPDKVSAQQNSNFEVKVMIDTSDRSIFGADAVINFPDSDLTVKSIAYGSFFTDYIDPVQNGGQIILRGSFFSSNTGSGNGSGVFATIVFGSSKNSGSGSVNFVCGQSGSNTDIIDSNGNNVLPCSNVFSLGLTYTAPPTNPPASTTPPTNACNGTCGSVYNCNVNLFCYQGYCRNPDCPSQTGCGCPSSAPASTKKPASKATPKPTLGATPTPMVIALTKFTPLPTIQEGTPAPLPETKAGKGISTRTAGIIIGAIILAIAGIIMVVSRMKGKNPPKFTPPTGPGFGNPPVNPPIPPTPAGF